MPAFFGTENNAWRKYALLEQLRVISKYLVCCNGLVEMYQPPDAYICMYILEFANWIGHILRRNCLLKQVIEGKIKGEMDVTRRRGRRRKKLLDDLKDRRGYSHLKEGALDRTMWRNRFGRGFGPAVRQTTE